MIRIEAPPGVCYHTHILKLEEKYITDKSGHVTEVILSRGDYQKLTRLLEDLEDRLEIKRRKRQPNLVAWDKVKAGLKRNGKL